MNQRETYVEPILEIHEKLQEVTAAEEPIISGQGDDL
jgi:hypothetical protein